MRSVFGVVIAFTAIVFTCATPSHTSPDAVDLASLGPDLVWRCANSTITSRRDDDGTVVWTWQIKGGAEAFLWLNESLPIYKELTTYQRLVYDVNFSEGQIDHFWPRTIGVLAPPLDKMFCEWNLFYFTHPHKTWMTYQQVFDGPTWFAFTQAFQFPPDVQLDRSRLMGFACLPKGQVCTVELRNVRLVRDRIRVEKYYLTTPIGWPQAEQGGGYRTAYFVKNLQTKAVSVNATVRSAHQLYEIHVEPPKASIAPGETQRFDVVASTGVIDRLPAPLEEETAVVDFVPDNDAAFAYRTETFCTVPLPQSARRLVLYTPSEIAEMKKTNPRADASADFWMSVDLSNATDIPHGVGHRVVMGDYTCPQCKKQNMHVTSKWLEVKCDNCGRTETHTLLADAAWIATWSSIHGTGPSPASLGEAYLRTGDERYARQAIRLLTLLAKHYETLTWHNANDPRSWDHAEPPMPGALVIGASARWGNSPSYGTNFMLQGLATVHNLVVDSPSWTDADRALVHDHFWVPACTEIMKITPAISNMNDIINRDLLLAGFSTGDANLIYRSTYHPMGIVSRLKDIEPDGFSDEGSALNYHLAAMNEWLPSIKLLLTSGLDFGDIKQRVIAAMKMPILRCDLTGTAYCTGNAGSGYFHVALDHPNFRLAEQFFPPEVWPRKRSYSTEPTLFRDSGWAILRTGETPQDQVVVNLDYGRSHGHGDLDRMHLGLQAFGQPLAANPGSSYNYNSNAPFGAAADSMSGPFRFNTVVVDGKDQLPGAGTLASWEITPDMQKVAADVSGVYIGVHWRRSVALVNNVVVVVDDLKSDQPHRYELAWHYLLKGNPVGATDDLSEPLGDGAYKSLLNPKKLTDSAVEMEWTNGPAHVHLWELPEPNQFVYTAQTGVCWNNVKGLPTDALFTRRQGNSARFISVIEPYTTQRNVKDISARNDGDKTTVLFQFVDGQKREITFDAAAAPAH